MNATVKNALVILILLTTFTSAWADKFSDTRQVFVNAGTQEYFDNAYGYALFPTIGKAGFVVGGAYGEGRVYEGGKHIGNTAMSQWTAGVQLGATGFSQVIFFENKAALVEFTSGSFEFGVKVEATILTASADASATTAGGSATASANKDQAITEGGGYQNGMAVFTVTKGGLMYEISLGGQKFDYTPL